MIGDCFIERRLYENTFALQAIHFNCVALHKYMMSFYPAVCAGQSLLQVTSLQSRQAPCRMGTHVPNQITGSVTPLACEHYDACLCKKASSVSSPSLGDGPLWQLVMNLHSNRCLIRALRVAIATVLEPAIYKLRSAKSSPIGKHQASPSHAQFISTASPPLNRVTIVTTGSWCRKIRKT